MPNTSMRAPAEANFGLKVKKRSRAPQLGLWVALRCTLLLLIISLQACTTFPPANENLDQSSSPDRYSRRLHQWQDGNEGVQVFLAFSGGGTRAAAFSYGVLEELRDTSFQADGQAHSLLGEVDTISAVSGGSFTAAYYGLYGDRIFEDFEERFLKSDVQSSLISGLFNPYNWWRSLWTGFDRTELAIEYYNKTMFHGATMGDMKNAGGPFVFINSTDLTTGNRFSFDKPSFDLICADIDAYPVANAVTASSAVPVLFNPIVLKNYADECHTPTHDLLDTLLEKPNLNLRQRNLLENADTLRDIGSRPYIHLVDGGISDNLGLRALVDWTDILGREEFSEQLFGADLETPRDIVLILANAALKPERTIDQSASSPSVAEMLSAVSDTQMLRYTLETQMLIQELAAKAETGFREAGVPINLHIVLLSFQDVDDPALYQRLNAIQTSFELPEEHVDELILAGRNLLRQNTQFKEFLGAINASQ